MAIRYYMKDQTMFSVNKSLDFRTPIKWCPDTLIKLGITIFQDQPRFNSTNFRQK